MFATIRWCHYTSAAALLGLACSSSTPSKTADSAGTGTPSEAQTATPAARSEGMGASGDGTSGQSAPAVNTSQAKTSAGDEVERVPVAGRDDAVRLDDARIVAITSAANEVEVEQGRLARKRAKDPRVRDLAAMMVQHHSEALAQQGKLKVTPEPGADVLNLQRESKQRLESLREKKGREFDRAYLELQIEGHRRLLDKLERELMPAAEDKALVSYLEEIRPRVESHLALAERLQNEMSTTSERDTPEPDGTRPVISNQRGADPKVIEPR